MDITTVNDKAQDAFWARVDRGGPDECWPWRGALSQGYGRLSVGRSKSVQATHVALSLVGVPVPAGMLACHTCDNPPCVNPNHLFVGTHTDNRRDRDRKGRNPSPVTHCRRGHAFTPENTERDGTSGRRCKTCRQARVSATPRGSRGSATCGDCGATTRRENMARHRRTQHEVVA